MENFISKHSDRHDKMFVTANNKTPKSILNNQKSALLSRAELPTPKNQIENFERIHKENYNLIYQER